MSFRFPNVPLAIAGVPAVLRRAGDLADAEQTLVAASRDVSSSVAAQRWGIFSLGGEIVLNADSIVSFEHSAEFRIADYPVEGGAFESYDKVATPFATRVAVSKGGTVGEREQFLNVCQALLESLLAYNVVTPERTYLNVNVTRIGLTRNATNGAGMTTVELVLQEVRQAAKASYSKIAETPALAAVTNQTQDVAPPVTAAPGTTKRPAAVRTLNQGSVQPKRVVVSGATLTTTASGRKLYTYDRPPGSR